MTKKIFCLVLLLLLHHAICDSNKDEESNTHLQNKRFALKFKFQRHVDIDQGIHKVKVKVAQNKKRKKLLVSFLRQI